MKQHRRRQDGDCPFFLRDRHGQRGAEVLRQCLTSMELPFPRNSEEPAVLRAYWPTVPLRVGEKKEDQAPNMWAHRPWS